MGKSIPQNSHDWEWIESHNPIGDDFSGWFFADTILGDFLADPLVNSHTFVGFPKSFWNPPVVIQVIKDPFSMRKNPYGFEDPQFG